MRQLLNYVNQLDAQNTRSSNVAFCDSMAWKHLFLHCSENCTGNRSNWSETLVCVNEFRPILLY